MTKSKRKTTFKILRQGSVEMSNNVGYLLLGNDEAVCFHIDPVHRAYVVASSYSDNNCPVIYLSDEDDGDMTEIEFHEFPGWEFHSGSGGKSIAISLVNRDKLESYI